MNLPDINDPLTKAKENAAALAEEAGDMARDHLVRPAQRLVRESRRKLSDMADNVTDALSSASGEAADIFCDQRDRAAGWISRNPFLATVAAAGAGVLLTMLIRKRN